jgi:carbon-monoxide dehydrogenase small subunit
MTAAVAVQLDINGRAYSLEIEPSRTLLDVLRKDLGLKGTKENCMEGECGACTVLIDGRAVNSCLTLAVTAQGKKITTIEGLAKGETLHPVQEAFIQEGAIQCGYCTPGFILSTIDLLNRHPHPTDDQINQGLAGNICRCTGYVKIRNAVRAAALKMGGEKNR